MNLVDLQTFSLVAETGTISAAAERLGVPKSTVSRRVRRLEDALGQDLLRRSARAVSLTEQGRLLHDRSFSSLQELQAAADAVTYADSEPQGLLRVTSVPGFGQSKRFVECIRDYGRKYPRTSVELELTTRLVNLAEEGFDVGVRLHQGPLLGSGTLKSRRLFAVVRAMYGSPTYLARRGKPIHPAELEGHDIVAHSIADVGPIDWRREGRRVGASMSLPRPRCVTNDTAALERFVLSDAGLALLGTLEAEDLVAQGRLVRVLPDYEQHGAVATLVWPERRHMAPRVRAFIDHAVQSMAGVGGAE